MRSINAAASLIALLAVTAGPAVAHDLRGYISASGVEFIEAQIPSYVPAQLAAPPFVKDFACMTATARDTTVNLEVQNLDISMPGADMLRVDITLGAHAVGVLELDDVYACFGKAVCTNNIDIDSARAIVDFQIRIDSGRPTVDLANLDLQLVEDDIDVTLSDCAIDGVVNTVVGFAKGWILGFIETKVEKTAEEAVGPLLQDMLGGFMQQDVALLGAEIAVAVQNLMVDPAGIELGVDVDPSSSATPAQCVGSDPGEPQTHDGAAPSFRSSMNAHVGMAVNFGLLDDVLYHVWRRGLTCITGDALEALGVHLDLEHISGMLPGFPAGTEIGLNIRLASPPRVGGRASADASMRVAVDGIEVDILADLPDGSERSLGLSLDVEAVATIAIDPGTNAMIARLHGAELKRLDLDEQAATQLGYDTAQIRTMMNTVVVPKLLEDMGDMPVTGSMFSFADYAVIMRNLDTSAEAYLLAEVDLFRAPANDTGAPDTAILGSPSGIASPASAVVRVGGTDPEIPSELLRYKVVVDGVERPLSAITEFKVGEIGVTRTYSIAVSSVDLSLNEDPSPALIDLVVDGLAPNVLILGDRIMDLPDGGAVTINWSATDDTTPSDRLDAAVKVYKLEDPQNVISAELVQEIAVPAGIGTATLDIDSGSVYRVEIEVEDDAGNPTTSAVLIDAGSGGCLCTAGSSGAGGALPFLLALFGANLVMRRRRHRGHRVRRHGEPLRGQGVRGG